MERWKKQKKSKCQVERILFAKNTNVYKDDEYMDADDAIKINRKLTMK
jgi:hypothetical protein